MMQIATSGGSVAVTTGALISASIFYQETLQVLFDLRWAVAFIAILVLTDFWSGLTASVKLRGEDFRFSRALRRTTTKFLEYVCYIVFGVLLFKACLEPFGIGSDVVGGAVGASVGFIAEFDSIYGHFCDLHHIKRRISVKRIFVAWLKQENENVGTAVEQAIEESEKDETDEEDSDTQQRNG